MSPNAATLSAGAALDLLQRAWAAQASGALMTSWMLHGRPGVGKSQIVRQLAEQIGARLFDVRLTTIEPQDLRGLPYYDHDQKKTIWYRPEDLPDDPGTPSILFLDELTAASPYLQPTVYGLLQERRVGQHLLPDSVLVIAAGNTIEDGAIAYEMGTALSDRLVHIHVQADADDWLKRYAGPRGLSPAVTAFLRARPDLLDTTEMALRRSELIACTPRAWERVSDIMNAVDDRRTRDAMVTGTIGDGVAAEFAIVADEVSAAVDTESLLTARQNERLALYPDSLHGMNALVFGLVGAAQQDNIALVIEVIEQIRKVAEERSEPVFAQLPLSELSAFGFEMLLAKAFEHGWQDAFAHSEAYAAYLADRRAQGLD